MPLSFRPYGETHDSEPVDLHTLRNGAGMEAAIMNYGGTLVSLLVSGLMNPSNAFVPVYTTKPQGSGIGLVLSRQIVEAHGGTIEVANV